MFLGLFTIKESPRFLASVGRPDEALDILAYLRRKPRDAPEVLHEFAESEAKEAFLAKGNFVRFVIAFVIFLLQRWSGQNSAGYYAPRIFASIGYTGTKNSLLASGVYGIIKFVSTTFFVFFGVESLGRRWSLFISSMGMGILFYILGAVLKTHPPSATNANDTGASPSAASKVMAAMLYIYVVFYSMGVGPLPWIYVSDIFPTRTRHYGLAVASASRWLWNYVVSKVTPDLITDLGWKIFMMFATIDIGALAAFALIIPETKGRSLEDMDVIFGTITVEQRQADITRMEEHIDHDRNWDASASSTRSMDADTKV
ncbi:hypothetical protein D9758_008577 [Tetrapyrgos nigripes]|uniref:Major facilitator superfamily (MFS) profile domain-containing protein n=1 Tax=Tetrapyrgos nigripes TaxID=182062 RepID=A0A8H5G5U2_9AGAR|nr:hypothetical protein D9758_008577 [Tetrapyrgos nigripes]